jgi:6-phosphogluconolactonase
VAVQDAHGNTVPNASASITVAIGTNSAGGKLAGTTTATVVDGVAVFPDLVIDKGGAGYTLIAEASGLTGATTNPFDVSLAPSRLVFAGQPWVYEVTNQPFPDPVRVSILDDEGKIVTSSTMSVTVALATGPPGAKLSGTSTVAAVNGVATLPDLSVDMLGSGYTLAASACSLIGAASSPFEGVSSANLTPGCLSLSPAASFGFQTVGTSSAPIAITLTNTCAGVEEKIGGGTAINGFNWQDWSLRSNCPPQLGPGGSCAFDVTFSPTGPGDRLGELRVNMDFPNEVSVTVDGTAVGALSMSVAPDLSGASGGFAYVANANSGNVSMYRIDHDTGVLASLVPPSISAGTNPASVAVDPSGKFAYVANAGSDDISTYKIGADGLLASIGPPVAAGTFPVSIAVAPDPAGGPGRFAYVANARSNDVSMYRIDPGTGALTWLGTVVVGSVSEADSAPWFVVVHPSGKFAYVASPTGLTADTHWLNSAVYPYTINGDTGALTPAGPFAGGGTNVPSSLAVDPSGSFLALTNQGTPYMNLFKIDPTTGALSGLDRTPLADQTATSVAISVRPSGKPFAYVTYGSGAYASQPGNHDNSVLTYGIGTSTSITSVAGAATAGVSPTSIAIDPSGRFAYVASSGSGDISMYVINADGTLTPLVPGTIGI